LLAKDSYSLFLYSTSRSAPSWKPTSKTIRYLYRSHAITKGSVVLYRSSTARTCTRAVLALS
jgi:hypothetical protein